MSEEITKENSNLRIVSLKSLIQINQIILMAILIKKRNLSLRITSLKSLIQIN